MKMNMYKSIFNSVALGLAVVALYGCVNVRLQSAEQAKSQIYQSEQQQARSQCYRQKATNEMTECLRRPAVSYEDYKKEREKSTSTHAESK